MSFLIRFIVQGRQKLARYGDKEFQNFVYDILIEISRRYRILSVSSPTKRIRIRLLLVSMFDLVFLFEIAFEKNDSTTALINAFIDSDDDNFYDKVASDDDYSPTDPQKRVKTTRKPRKILPTTNGFASNEMKTEPAPTDLRSRLANTELQVKYLACAHIDLKNELAVLHQMVLRRCSQMKYVNFFFFN